MRRDLSSERKSSIRMALSIKANLKSVLILDMALAYKYGRTVLNMKAIGGKMSLLAGASSITSTEMYMMVTLIFLLND